MPHISVKMLEGRSEQAKQELARELVKTLAKTLNCGETYITVTIRDYTAQEWQDVFADEMADDSAVYVTPKYDPKSLL